MAWLLKHSYPSVWNSYVYLETGGSCGVFQKETSGCTAL